MGASRRCVSHGEVEKTVRSGYGGFRDGENQGNILAMSAVNLATSRLAKPVEIYQIPSD